MHLSLKVNLFKTSLSLTTNCVLTLSRISSIKTQAQRQEDTKQIFTSVNLIRNCELLTAAEETVIEEDHLKVGRKLLITPLTCSEWPLKTLGARPS